MANEKVEVGLKSSNYGFLLSPIETKTPPKEIDLDLLKAISVMVTEKALSEEVKGNKIED